MLRVDSQHSYIFRIHLGAIALRLSLGCAVANPTWGNPRSHFLEAVAIYQEFNRQNSNLLSQFASLHSHLGNSRIYFDVFYKQTSRLLSHLGRSRIHFGIFRKQTRSLLSQFAYLLK